MNALPPEFYKQELDVIDLIFKQFPGTTIPDENYFEKQLAEKERALDIITSKLSKNVMDNYDKFGMYPVVKISPIQYLFFSSRDDTNS